MAKNADFYAIPGIVSRYVNDRMGEEIRRPDGQRCDLDILEYNERVTNREAWGSERCAVILANYLNVTIFIFSITAQTIIYAIYPESNPARHDKDRSIMLVHHVSNENSSGVHFSAVFFPAPISPSPIVCGTWRTT